MSSSRKTDILVLGATGFTGRLITRYLAIHPQFTQGLFSFAIAARSQSKLHTLVQELALPPNIGTVQVDVGDYASVEAAVQSVKVVINTVGPYWRHGTPVVRACVKNGVHYVDLAGEDIWIRDIIQQFDYLATKTGAVIVPACGYDSVPSDVSAFLSNRTLKAHGPYDVGSSTTAHKVKGGISGGTFATMMMFMEEVPKDKLRESRIAYSLSPVKGRVVPDFRLIYNHSIPGEPSQPGAFFFMSAGNRKIVQRTFGLLEVQAIKANSPDTPPNDAKVARRERYGPDFVYDEFLAMPSKLSAAFVSTILAVGFGVLYAFAPARWLLKKFMPQPGSGPSAETLRNGYFEATNHTISTSTPPVHVKSVFKGDRDPGYALTAVMISESALSLLHPPVSKPDAKLPALGRKGGVLTPMSAFGDVLITRLVDTGRFSFESSVVGQGQGSVEGRKDV